MADRAMFKKGETWKIKEARSPGLMVVTLLQDVPRRVRLKMDRGVAKPHPDDDAMFDVQIVSGKKGYVSIENSLDQKITGKGTAGTVVTLRRTLTRFLKQVA